MPSTLYVGFELGVLVDIEVDPTTSDWPEHTYAHLARIGSETRASACLLPIDRINVSALTGTAWAWDTASGVWRRSVIPLPHALYNRIGRRRTEASRAGRRLLARLAASRPLFNPGFLDKLRVYQALQEGGLSHIMPEFALLSRIDQATAFYLRHSDIYIKPSGGSLGRGVARLLRRGADDNRLTANGATPHSLYKRRFFDEELPALFHRLSRKGVYVLQASVRVARWRGRKVDVRVLMQKDATGRWVLTGAAGRVARKGGLTTHTVRGGERVSLKEMLCDGTTPLPTLNSLEALCRRASACLETRLEQGYFELSYDIAVDVNGKPLILEANAKPFPFDEEKIRLAAAERLIAFARAVTINPQILAPLGGTEASKIE